MNSPAGPPASWANTSQAEATYSKTLEETNRLLESLEKALQGAANTKIEVKSGIKEFGKSFREFLKVAKTLRMIRSLDTTEQLLKEQQQQQLKTLEIVKEIQAAQGLRCSKDGPIAIDQINLTADVVKGLKSLNARLDTYEGKVDKLLHANTETTTTEKSEAWTEVAKRPRKNTKQKTGSATVLPGANTDGQRRPRKRNPAIMVDSKPEDFPMLAQKLSKGVDQQAIGNKVVGMRQTRNGGMLIEINGDTTAVETVKEEVIKAAGEGASVRILAQKSLLEVRDIASWADKDDVLQAFTSLSNGKPEEINVINIRKKYGGSLVATILVPWHIADKIAVISHIKIGMVYCRARVCETHARCYRCQAMGHEPRDCTGPNREKCCRKCGREGHFAAQCGANQEAASTFRRLLVEESSRPTARPTAQTESLLVEQ